MKLVEQRISDRSVLKLIRMWLKSPVYEEPRKKTPKSAWERKAQRKAEKTLKGKQSGTLTLKNAVELS